MNTDHSLSVLVLAYNEETTIALCLEEVLYACSFLKSKYEIIIVNDASVDQTQKVAQGFIDTHPGENIRLVSNLENRGYGGAYKSGLAEAKMAYCVPVGAVNAIHRDSLREIFSQVGQKDMVISYILNPEARPRHRRIISKLHTKLIDFLYGYRLKYYCGCNIFPTQRLKETPFSSSHAFLVDILLRFLDAGLSYNVVPMTLKVRKHEHSNALRLKTFYGALVTLVRIFISRKMKFLPKLRITKPEKND